MTVTKEISNPYEGCRICKGKGYVESVEHVTPCMACYNRSQDKLDLIHEARPPKWLASKKARPEETDRDVDAFRAALDWFAQKRVLQKAQTSRLHEALSSHLCTIGDGAKDLAWLAESIKGIQVFLVQHDWASVIEPTTGEYRLPADPAAFEFQISGRRMIIVTRDGEYATLVETSEQDWCLCKIEVWKFDDQQEVIKQIRAISIMLDAEVAVTEAVRAPHRLNVKREKSGKLPIYDHHVVKLANRKHVLAGGNESSARNGPRLHFRRGHWRHYDGWKTWINWTLVGNPDLGFVDKDYLA